MFGLNRTPDTEPLKELRNTMTSGNSAARWLDLVAETPQSAHLKRVLGQTTLVDKIRVHEVTVHAIARLQVSVRFDLIEFPRTPPTEWEKFNTIQVTLDLCNPTL